MSKRKRRKDARRDNGGDRSPGDVARAGGPLKLVGSLQRIQSRLAIMSLCLLTLLLSSLIFPNLGWWPLAWVCLVPWLVCVCTAASARALYLFSFGMGFAFFLINIRWMYLVTGPGWLCLCLMYAPVFPLAAWPIRHAYRRRGISVAIVAPIVWVGIEYLRSIAPLGGFPWLLWGHSQYKILTVIQISDLVGAYGVSFVLLMVNGWLTDLMIQPILIRRPGGAARMPIGSLTTLVVVLGTLIYGGTQGSSSALQEDGPKIAMIQHDIPMYVDSSKTAPSVYEVLDGYLAITRRAAQDEDKPDLIVLPETAMIGSINESFLTADAEAREEIYKRRFPPTVDANYVKQLQDFGTRVRDGFQNISTQFNVPIVLGSSAMEWKPTALPPRVDKYNSAYLLLPGRSQAVARYDKRHLVLFGEYVPFRNSSKRLYEFLNSMTPWGKDGRHYSLTPGDEYVTFDLDRGEAGGSYRAAVPICYEEIMPYISRDFTAGDGSGKNIDILLSISNDGWFHHASELEQHLAAAVFRAIENRIVVARSVNTGASALILPNGHIHRRVTLSDEKIAKLRPAEAALQKLAGRAEDLQAQSGKKKAYEEANRKLGQALEGELRPALEELGLEFRFVYTRLRGLKGMLTPNNKQLATAIERFTGQVKDDLDMMDRWRNRPWTAPGYAIDQARFDSRLTLYTRFGDWFVQAAVGLTILVLLDWFQYRLVRRKKRNPETEGDQG